MQQPDSHYPLLNYYYAVEHTTVMVAPTANKGSTKATDMSHHPTHPSWSDMITECIMTTAEGPRQGVSRPAIKKFVDSKYHLSMNAAATSQLNRAITHGITSGKFALPKGPSGKVKLTPKRAGEIAKENKKPKQSIVTKASRRPVSSKTKELPSGEERPLKVVPKTIKYTSMAKQARITPIPGRRVPPRKAITQRGGAKKVLTRSSSAATSKRIMTRGMAEKRRNK